MQWMSQWVESQAAQYLLVLTKSKSAISMQHLHAISSIQHAKANKVVFILQTPVLEYAVAVHTFQSPWQEL
jgi:hypothetical protein